MEGTWSDDLPLCYGKSYIVGVLPLQIEIKAEHISVLNSVLDIVQNCPKTVVCVCMGYI